MKGIAVFTALLFLTTIAISAEDSESQKDKKFQIEFSSSLGSSFVVSHVNLNHLSGLGIGPVLNLGLSHLFFENTYLLFSASYSFMLETNDYISSFGMPCFSLSIGYSFPILNELIITPLLGGGYLVHIIDGDIEQAREDMNYNSHNIATMLLFQCEADINIGKGLSFYITPGYTVFNEINGWGSYLKMDVGLKYTFTPEDPSEWTKPKLVIDKTVFSPNGDSAADSIIITPQAEHTKGLKSYELYIVDNKGNIILKNKVMKKKFIPFTWNGLDERKNKLKDGEYHAELIVYYYNKSIYETESQSFLIDTTPPEINLTINPPIFSADSDGVDDDVTIAMTLEDASAIASWRLDITGAEEEVVTTFKGKGKPPAELVWDGNSTSGKKLKPAAAYSLVVEAIDEAGNKNKKQESIALRVSVKKEADIIEVDVPSIIFPPFSSNYLNVSDTQASTNLEIIEQLVEIFEKYKDYKIVIQGHAVSLLWEDPVAAEAEQQEVLIPLSQQRAEEVKQEFVERGIDAERITTVGIGGAQPLVPFDDEENVWKNRRVEFVLIKE